MTPNGLAQLEREGFVVLPGVYSPGEIERMIGALESGLGRDEQVGPIRSEQGTVYAARNVADLWPAVTEVWQCSPLREALVGALGPGFGLVRVLYFDKPPGQTWALPWHKDLTIAVRDNRLPSHRFGKPTRKAGVPHVEAPCAVLETMLTARIHLDPTDEENGALRVLPGSHRSGTKLELAGEPFTVRAGAGDVLLIRPLVAHCSGRSHSETTRHRRILHLEFAASAELPDGYAWHSFIPQLSSGRNEETAGRGGNG
jgi:hypothetical protein